MVLWIILAIISVAAAAVALMPLFRRSNPLPETGGQDVAVYKDQMRGVESDLARGLIAASEADAARSEIGRRLLAADKQSQSGAAAPAENRSRTIAFGSVLFIVLFSLSVYGFLGQPDAKDQPLAARISEPTKNKRIEALIAQVEKHLDKKPEDGKGWEVLAPVYFRLGRFGDAEIAYRNAIRLLGATGDREADLAEAIVAGNDGMVTAEARAAFERANKLKPDAVRPRFFLAMALAQEGRNEEAATAWQTLIASAKGDEPWVPVAKSQLARVNESLGRPTPPDPAESVKPTGPSASDLKSAGEMAPADRQAMIEAMVTGLNERLRGQGGTIDEWLRLVRSYAVLGNKDAAVSAAAAAKKQFNDDTGAKTRIDGLLTSLGLEN